MRAGGVDSAFFVCVAFDDADLDAYAEVERAVSATRADHTDLFIKPLLVDGRRRASASRA
jgi:hypothetical protein